MPSRIIREGILSSDNVDGLTDAGEVFYRRLMSVVDDFGLFHGNPKLIRAACYPLRVDDVSIDDIEDLIQDCRRNRLVATTVIAGKSIIAILRFGQHARAKSSKFAPGSADEIERLTEALHEQCMRDADALQIHAEEAQAHASAHLIGCGDGVVDGVVDGLRAIERPPSGASTAKGKRLPDAFPDADALDWAKVERPDLDPDQIAAKFRDYWIALPGAKGRKLDWVATWRNFVRNEFERRPPARAAPAMNANALAAAQFGGAQTPEPETFDAEPSDPPRSALGFG